MGHLIRLGRPSRYVPYADDVEVVRPDEIPDQGAAGAPGRRPGRVAEPGASEGVLFLAVAFCCAASTVATVCRQTNE